MDRRAPIRLHDGVLHLTEGTIERPHGRVGLSVRERAVLEPLVHAEGAVVPRSRLADALGGGARSVDFAVRRLRTKLEADPSMPRHVLTVHGEGYRFARAHDEAEVVASSAGRAWPLPDGAVDLSLGVVRRGTSVARLTAKESGVLEALVDASPEPVPRDQLAALVWGRRVTSAVRYVDQVVHQLRGKLEQDRSAPRVVVSVPGRGVALRAADPVAGRPNNLRRGTDSFVGRDEDVDAIAHTDRRIVTLLGPGGVGKTRLAQAVAACWLETASVAEAWFCDLSTARSLDDVVHTVAAVLGSPARSESVQHALRARCALALVLDNAESSPQSVAQAVQEWMQSAPEVRFLITSREPLRTQGEWVVPVRPLTQSAAVALLQDRVGDSGGDPGWSEPELGLAGEIVRRLDGLPLAIELVAPRVRWGGLEQLLDDVEDRFAVTSGRRGGPTRHHSLWNAFACAWEGLSVVERTVLSQCTVFQGGFTVASAQAVVQAEHADVLRALHDKCWLQQMPHDDLRLAMMPSARDFVTRVAPPDEAWARRHAAWFAGRAHKVLTALARAGWDPQTTGWLRTEHANLAAAIRHAASEDDVGAAMEAAAAGALFEGRSEDARALAERLPPGGPASEARRRCVVGAAAGARATVPQWQAAVQAARDAGDDRLLVRAQCALGRALARRGRDAALSVADEVEQRARAAGLRAGEGRAWQVRATLHLRRGDPGAAARCLERAQGLGVHLDLALPRGIAHFEAGEVGRAVEVFEAGLADARFGRGRAAESQLRGRLAIAHLVAGFPERAELELRQCLRGLARRGTPDAGWAARALEVDLALVAGAWTTATDRAAALIEQVDAMQLGASQVGVRTMGALGWLAQGAPERALDWLDEAIEHAIRIRWGPWGDAARWIHACAWSATGDCERGIVGMDAVPNQRPLFAPLHRVARACVDATPLPVVEDRTLPAHVARLLRRAWEASRPDAGSAQSQASAVPK